MSFFCCIVVYDVVVTCRHTYDIIPFRSPNMRFVFCRVGKSRAIYCLSGRKRKQHCVPTFFLGLYQTYDQQHKFSIVVTPCHVLIISQVDFTHSRVYRLMHEPIRRKRGFLAIDPFDVHPRNRYKPCIRSDHRRR
jgi:hypothetical protein